MRSVLVTDIGTLVKQHIGINQQIIEIHGVARLAPLPIAHINIGYGRHLRVVVGCPQFNVRNVFAGQYQVVFGVAYAALYRTRLIYFLVQRHLLDNGLYQALRVGRVVDGKVGRESQYPGFGTQQTREDGVKRSHPQVTGTLRPYLTGYSLFHLPSRLVRKGQS